jgi:hypothetical protein
MPNDSQDVTVRRAYQIYLYAVCFVTVLVALFTAAEAVYSLVRIIAPGTTAGGGSLSGSERDAGVAGLIRNVILGGAAAAIFAFHWGKSIEARAELDRATTPSPPIPPELPATPKRAPRKRTPPAS